MTFESLENSFFDFRAAIAGTISDLDITDEIHIEVKGSSICGRQQFEEIVRSIIARTSWIQKKNMLNNIKLDCSFYKGPHVGDEGWRWTWYLQPPSNLKPEAR